MWVPLGALPAWVNRPPWVPEWVTDSSGGQEWSLPWVGAMGATHWVGQPPWVGTHAHLGAYSPTTLHHSGVSSGEPGVLLYIYLHNLPTHGVPGCQILLCWSFPPLPPLAHTLPFRFSLPHPLLWTPCWEGGLPTWTDLYNCMQIPALGLHGSCCLWTVDSPCLCSPVTYSPGWTTSTC